MQKTYINLRNGRIVLQHPSSQNPKLVVQHGSTMTVPRTGHWGNLDERTLDRVKDVDRGTDGKAGIHIDLRDVDVSLGTVAPSGNVNGSMGVVNRSGVIRNGLGKGGSKDLEGDVLDGRVRRSKRCQARSRKGEGSTMSKLHDGDWRVDD